MPLEGSLWVDPAAGTVLRTRLHMRNFADTITITPSVARATTRSTDSDFKQFGASAKVVPQ